MKIHVKGGVGPMVVRVFFTTVLRMVLTYKRRPKIRWEKYSILKTIILMVHNLHTHNLYTHVYHIIIL